MAAPASSAISRLVALPDDARTLGPFRLVKQLGKGGFAPVWLAKEVYGDSELRTVAVKLFAAGEATRAQRELIVQEARALCRVEHLNVVRFYALTPGAEGTVLGLVMEYVRGASLDRGLEEVERLPVAEALAVGQAIAWALAAVHAAGLVHRDVKPGNVVEAITSGRAAMGAAAASSLRTPAWWRAWEGSTQVDASAWAGFRRPAEASARARAHGKAFARARPFAHLLHARVGPAYCFGFERGGGVRRPLRRTITSTSARNSPRRKPTFLPIPRPRESRRRMPPSPRPSTTSPGSSRRWPAERAPTSTSSRAAK